MKHKADRLNGNAIGVGTGGAGGWSVGAIAPNRYIDPFPCHPGKDQNISGHIVLVQNVCVV